MANISGINSIDSLLHSSWAAYTNTPVALTYSFMTAVSYTHLTLPTTPYV